jgi:hypothetical protein
MRLHALLPPVYEHDNAVNRQMRGWLRELVYTGNNYGEDNDWGPFKPDGTVNWSLLDAISFIMSEPICRQAALVEQETWQTGT